MSFDRSKYTLGVLCRRKHEYGNSGMTLRRTSNSTCPICAEIYNKQYRIDNKNKTALYNKTYRQKNADKIKQYRIDTAEYSSLYNKHYYIKNKEHINSRNAKWMDENKEKVSDWHKQYAQTEQGKFNNNRSVHNYRARKLNNSGSYTADEWSDTLTFFENECAYCGDIVEHKDHLHPLHLGGNNNIYNLVPSCSRCNFSKNSSLVDDWYPKQTFYDYDRHIQLNEYVINRYYQNQFKAEVS